MFVTLTIRAVDVRLDDELFNNLAPHPVYRWVRVKAISRFRVGLVKITTFAWDTLKHDEEGITVQRQISKEKHGLP